MAETEVTNSRALWVIEVIEAGALGNECWGGGGVMFPNMVGQVCFVHRLSIPQSQLGPFYFHCHRSYDRNT